MTSPESAPACPIANITRKGRTRRALAGAAAGLVAVVAFAILDDDFGSRWWRLGLVPLLGFAALCLFQAQEST
jgi:peptidoglycan/LPS O-acetylase OafA/YrhL